METHGVDWGSRETNGCGTFNGVTDKALREIARMGFTHIWLTGVLRHATQTAHPGLAAQPESIVKGLAGSPYAVVDYFDVDPDLASSPEKRMDEFKALVKRCRTVGLLPMIDFIPNHVSRAYLADWDGHDDFGEGDAPVYRCRRAGLYTALYSSNAAERRADLLDGCQDGCRSTEKYPEESS